MDRAPGAPEDLEITNAGQNGQNPVLEWDANYETDLDYYEIYRGLEDLETSEIVWNDVATTSNTTWTDNDVTISSSSGIFFYYKITAVDDGSNESDYSNTASTEGSWELEQNTDPAMAHLVPTEIALHQNYPNPFNPETAIRFDLPEAAHVKLTIYNMLGEKVRTLLDGHQETGYHNISWDGKNGAGEVAPSGLYVYRIDVDVPGTLSDFTQVRKMTLLR